ncbi:MAG TPA: glycosyltransferase, partial [Thermoanaerobaculia bacterium]|nr:glycosyltransferase [Thermoanaerobaculia bacterium]
MNARADIIIPVYGAADELARCLASVAKHTDLTKHRLLLVIDGPQDDAVEAAIAGHELLRNETRLGFVASVNRGMRALSNDVVLLNSDTIVTARWLEKLTAAAYSSERIGTITPLSNHATLCSVPRAFEENLLPNHYDADSFGALVERVSQRSYIRIPTAVGVCMYIRRALLDEIGFFDEKNFGLGYGEENDFCMRALERGWFHIADDATFIYHAGHRSFGKSRAGHQRKAAAALKRLHPRYMKLIAEFMNLDPLADVRERINKHLRQPATGNRQLRVAHLVHGWPPFQHAGTELYAHWLVQQQRARHHVAVYTRGADANRAEGEAIEWMDGGVRVRIITNNFTIRNPLRRNALRNRELERDFERFLKSERPDLLHVHHLAGHTFSLVRVARRLGIPIVLQIQDWWFLCARVNYLHRDGNRCSGPAPEKCASCATLTKIAPASITNRLLHAIRRRAARKAIDACDAYIAGSNAIRNDYAPLIPRSKPFHVIPYGVAIEATREGRRPATRPIRFGYVGSIAPHKGVHTAAEAMRGIDPSQATLRAWGDASAMPEYTASMSNVDFAGTFREEVKPRVFAEMDVLIVPSIGLESFGLAAREAMACGVPVIASAGGALSEMFEPGTCGEFFPAGDASALRAILRRVIDDPSIIDAWSARITTPKRADTHALEIERVYAQRRTGSQPVRSGWRA